MNAAPFLSAEWRFLLMQNYRIDPEILLPYVPRGTELDFFNGETYATVVGFVFLRTKLKGVTVPLHGNFEELNLRFYVRRKVNGEVRRGVVFVKEIVPRWAVSTIARWVYNENYTTLPMDREIPPEVRDGSRIEYRWRIGPRWHRAGGHVAGELCRPEEQSREHFIIEHYWGYTAQKDGGTIEYRVEHAPWKIWNVPQPYFETDVAALYGPQFKEALGPPPVTAFVVDGSEVVLYDGVRI